MKRILVASCSIFSLGFGAHAVAQDRATVTTTTSTALPEIVVTAQRRAETAQKAAVTIAALGADTLAKENVTQFEDLSSILPNTEVTSAGGPRVVIAVRGIRNNDFSPGSESPVAVSLDGAYIPRMTELAGMFYDIARVESLPGPQGTLYGRNAAAGAVNIITNHPVQREEAAAEVETGNYGLLRGSGMLNVPVNSELALRAAFQSYQHSGYDKDGLNDAQQRSGRLQAQWNHGPSKLFLSVDYSTLGGKGVGDNDLRNPAYDGTRIYSPQIVGNSSIDIKSWGATAQWDYDLKFATLTTELSHRESNERTWTLGGGQISDFLFNSNANIAEVRLASNKDRPLQWVGGLYFFEEKQPSLGYVSLNAANPYGFPGNALPEEHLHTLSYAAFGQATWTPIDPLHLTVGLRYSGDRKDYNGDALCQSGVNLTIATSCIPLDAGSPGVSHSLDYKAGVAYDLTSTSLLYFNTATGYRAGGSFISPFHPTYGPEHMKNYEIGWKNTLFDHRMTLNFDGFIEQYQDYIFTYGVTGLLPLGPGIIIPFSIAQADNFGRVDIAGADASMVYALTRDDLINVGVEWMTTKIGAGVLRCNAPVPTLTACSTGAGGLSNPVGRALPNTPDWRLTGAYEHTFHLGNGATLTPRVQTHWESGRWMELAQTPGTYQSAFTKTDASLSYKPDGAKWNVSVWVENLENKAVFQTAGSSTSVPAAFPSGVAAIYRAPRTFGVKFGAKF